MKRQRYFPFLQAEEPEWFTNFGDTAVATLAPTNIDPLIVAERVKDAKYCGHAVGTWLAEQRAHGKGATAAIEQLYFGTSAGTYTLPVFTVPLPAGIVAVSAGALDRIFRFVQDIKNADGYNEAIGQALRIIGSEEGPPPDLPTFSTKLEMGMACHCVRLTFKKFGRMGVVIESRRGPNGAWEMIAIDTSSPYLDERDLLVAGQPEVREYRMRFWDDGVPTGDWTPIQRVTVSPS